MRTLDDVYREVLWRTSLTNTDFPYIYTAGGAYGFLQTFSDIYKQLITEVIACGSDYFLDRSFDSLVANQEDYSFPNDMVRLRHIEFQYNGVDWTEGTQLNISHLYAGTEQNTVSDASEYHPYFWAMGSINTPSSTYRIAPRPLTARSSGIKLYYDRMPSALFGTPISAAVSATSAQVTFPGQFEFLIPLGISVEIWGKYGLQQQKAEEIARYRQGIEDMKRLLKPRIAVGQSRMKDFREFGRDY